MSTGEAPVRAAPARAEPERVAPDAGALAWLVVVPVAAVVVLAIALLGPPLGNALFAPGSERFWFAEEARPEPVEHARFALALLGAPLAVAALLALERRGVRLPPRRARPAILVAQASVVAFVVLALLAQRDVLLDSSAPRIVQNPVFPLPMLAFAALVPIATLAVLRRPGLVEWIARAAGETRVRRIACAALATLLAAVWLLAGFNTESTIGNAEANHLIPWDMSETFAVLNGRTPLVDFHSQYAQLFPYVAALALGLLGTSVGVWTATMLVFSGLALLAVYAVLRRIAGSSLLALALFVPFLAGGFLLIQGRLSPAEIFSLWPMRYGPPYLLAWLTARHLDRLAPRRRLALLVVGGLVALNNLEFGLSALAATVAALVYADPPRSRRAAGRLLGEVLAGLLAAATAVAAISLAHSGRLPDPSLLLEFPRLYGMEGWALERMPTMGFHLVLLATFVAAILLATVRAVRGDEERLLTGMLVWSGLFGLGAGAYFMGRSDDLNLISLFSAWCFALTLLAIVVVRALASRAGRRPTLPELAVLLGWGLAAAAVAQLPPPWKEVDRLQRTTERVFKQAAVIELVKATTTPGEKVAILIPLGHRVAYDAGVVDVAPYSSIESMPVVRQMHDTLDLMRREGATRVYVDALFTSDAHLAPLLEAGYRIRGQRSRYLMLTPGSSAP